MCQSSGLSMVHVDADGGPFDTRTTRPYPLCIQNVTRSRHSGPLLRYYTTKTQLGHHVHAGLSPANFTTLPHFSVSSATSLPESTGKPRQDCGIAPHLHARS